MENNKAYVVNKTSGEASEIDRDSIYYLIGFKIIDWDDKFQCYVFDNKNKKFIYNENIEKIFNEYQTIDTIVGDILTGLDKIKYNRNVGDISVIKGDYKVIINKSGVDFYNFLGTKNILYYKLDNIQIFDKVVKYIDNMFENFIEKITRNDNLTEADKKLFDEITIGNPNVMAKYISDKISIKNIFGYTCLIKNNLMGRVIMFIGHGKPPKKLRLQSSHMSNLLKYFKK